MKPLSLLYPLSRIWLELFVYTKKIGTFSVSAGLIATRLQRKDLQSRKYKAMHATSCKDIGFISKMYVLFTKNSTMCITENC